MRRYFIVLLIIATAVLSSCTSGIDYSTLDAMMGRGECDAAPEYIEQGADRYGDNARLLYHLDLAMVNMLCGKHEDSNRSFRNAEDIAEELWTKSITREAASFLLNDYTKPYAGEDYERALINLLSAINYAVIGDHDGSLVEVRRLDANLLDFNDRYEKKNIYKEDAFGRYLSGVIYEASGKLDDAFIDYLKAYNIYGDYRENYGTYRPEILIEDLIRVARKLRRDNEITHIIEANDGRYDEKFDAGRYGKVVMIHFNGVAPVKVDDKFIFHSSSGPITVAFPSMIVKEPVCRHSRMTLISGDKVRSFDSELVEDINGIALKTLDDRRGRLTLKEITRVFLKQGVINAATDHIDDEGARLLAKVLLNVVNIAVEQADTRSWRTLPGEVHMARAFVPPGNYWVNADSCGSESTLIPSLSIKAGETKFLLFETMY
ncbi:MAG: hypothetical protein JSV21_08700 [Nitrospirota bacterium]|nr:MAG: hypothetical protein JSV21_08700 [Nitrospirota bacterium]